MRSSARIINCNARLERAPWERRDEGNAGGPSETATMTWTWAIVVALGLVAAARSKSGCDQGRPLRQRELCDRHARALKATQPNVRDLREVK
jgi:hypothetical protein